MPVNLPAASRRAFLAHLGGAIFGDSLRAAQAGRVDPDRIAILNDTHIGGIHPDGATVPTRLRETVAAILDAERHPAAVIINGDLALNEGRRADYEHFARLIAPLKDAGIPVHFTLGNHDDREAFHEVMMAAKARPADIPVMSKHVTMVALPKANLFLLDSLKRPLVMQGFLGADQLEWLGRMLDAHADKPALVFAHHHPLFGAEARYSAGALEDSQALWDLLVSRPQVKAYVHGHLHRRNHLQHSGIHILETPATGFVSRPAESATGWTMAQLTDSGAEVTTVTHQQDHPWNGTVKKLIWKTA